MRDDITLYSHLSLAGRISRMIHDHFTKPPAYRLFTQPFVQTHIKESIKAPCHWPLWGEFTGDRWIPRTKGQWRGKCFHLMTSSCLHRRYRKRRALTWHCTCRYSEPWWCQSSSRKWTDIKFRHNIWLFGCKGFRLLLMFWDKASNTQILYCDKMSNRYRALRSVSCSHLISCWCLHLLFEITEGLRHGGFHLMLPSPSHRTENVNSLKPCNNSHITNDFF